MDEKTIRVSELKGKRKELEEVAKDAQEKIRKIDYVLEAFAGEAMPTMFVEESKNPTTHAKTAILEIIKDSSSPIKKWDIYNILIKKGYQFAKSTFEVKLTELSNEGKVTRPQYGMYQAR